MAVSVESYADRSLASEAAAHYVAAAIRRKLAESEYTSFVVSGGSSPEQCYKVLSETDLEWERVFILPGDERYVPADHDASNEKMIRRLLVTGRASAAQFVPMFNAGSTPEERCGELTDQLKTFPLPSAASLLGIGEDGHFASLFPDIEGIDEGLSQDSELSCMVVKTAASEYPRVTLTLSALLQSDEILLLFFGDTKRETFEKARNPGSEYPVSSLLLQQRTPVRVIWAP
jgi:6-phosphogluconolactonase